MSNDFPHPGRWIRQQVIPSGLTVAAAAKQLGVSRPALSNLLNGNAALSPEMAAKLEAVFAADAADLLKRQSDFDAALSKGKQAALVARPYVPPFLQIRANAITNWASQGIEPRQRFAVFLRQLVNSTGVGLSRVDFPGNDDAQRPGWDGEVVASGATPWVPEGHSVWEFGVNQAPKGKANGDYAKAVKATAAQARRDMTFVFVTPQRWEGKATWVEEKQKEGHWKRVAAYDAADLEQWLDQSLAGQVWFANETGQDSIGTSSLDHVWRRWLADCEPTLVPALFDPPITAHKDLVQKRLSEAPYRPIVVTADSKEEGLAFLSALFTADDPALGSFRDRIIVFETADMLRRLASRSSNFIPVIANGDVVREFTPYSANMPSFVIYPRNATNADPDIVLETLHWEAFTRALAKMNLSSDQTERLARETARSPTILRRRLSKTAEIRTPQWASDHDVANRLVPLVLAGAWKADNETDQYLVSYLAGDVPYEEVERRVAGLLGLDSSPIWRVGSFRGITSKIDTLFAVQSSFVRKDIERFFDVARIVLSEDDPALALPEKDRWAAAIYGKSRQISGALREGIAESLVLLAVHGNNLFQRGLGLNLEYMASELVQDLLSDLTAEKLESQADNLPLYAEAAPDAFLEIIERDLTTDAPATLALMRPISEFPFARAPRTGLLWALETLAWAPSRLTRTVLILGRLSEKAIDDNLSNKPIRSLEAIFRSWMPQTEADLDGRMAALNKLVTKHPSAAWPILVSQFEVGSRIGEYSSNPKWRTDGHGYGQPIKNAAEINKFGLAAFEMAVSWPEHTKATVADLVSNIGGLDEALQDKVWDAVERWADSATEEDRAWLREEIRVASFSRRAIRRRTRKGHTGHRAAALYESLQPKDVLLRHEWLFRNAWVEESYDELQEEEFDFRAREARIEIARTGALNEVYSSLGLRGVLDLARMGQAAQVIGHILPKILPSASLKRKVAVELVQAREVSVLSGFLWGLGDGRRLTLLKHLATQAQGEERSTIFSAAPFRRETWEIIEQLGEDASSEYWSTVNVKWVDESEVVYAVDRLLKASRPMAAFTSAHFHLKSLPAKTLYSLLEAISDAGENEAQQYRLDRHYLQKAFEQLDASGELAVESLAMLEFKFIEAFDHDSSAPNLERYIGGHPEAYVQLVAMAYRPATDGREDPAPESSDAERRRTLASAAYSALARIKSVPARGRNGEVDEEKLLDWIALARSGFSSTDRRAIGDVLIGKLLAHAPADPDGLWPCVAVRNALEEISNKDLRSGFSVEVYNSRGAHWRGEGGDQERSLAEKYASLANAVSYTHPRTADILRSISESYARDAEWQDNEALVQRRMR